MLTNKDPLVDSVKRVMEENAIRAEVEALVNESYGITSRKALPYEALEEYDAVLAEAIADALDENSAENAGGLFGGAKSYVKQAWKNDKKKLSAQWNNDIKPTLKSAGTKGASDVRGVVRNMMDKSMNGYIKNKLEGGVHEETLNEAVQQINEIGDTPRGKAALRRYVQLSYAEKGANEKEAEKTEAKRQKYSGKKIHVGAAVKRKGAPWKKSRKNKARYVSAKHKEWSEKASKASNKLQNRSVGVFRALQRLKEDQLDEISKELAGRYINKANYDGGTADFAHGMLAGKGRKRGKAKYAMHALKRERGIKQAVKKLVGSAKVLAKEESLNEQTILEEIRTNLTESIYNAYLEGGDTFDQIIDNLTEEELNLLYVGDQNE